MPRVSLVLALFAALPLPAPVLAQAPPPPPAARVTIFNYKNSRGWFGGRSSAYIYLDGQALAYMADNSAIWFDIPTPGRHLLESDNGAVEVLVLDPKASTQSLFFRTGNPRFTTIPAPDPKDTSGVPNAVENAFLQIYSKPGQVDTYSNTLKITVNANTQPPAPAPPPTPPPPPEKFGNDEVIAMVRDGQTDFVIIRKIQSTPSAKFDVTAKGLSDLHKANVSDSLVTVIMDQVAAAAAAAAAKK